MGSESVMVSHLQYADDTIMFTEADKEGKELRKTIECFDVVSRIKINWNKSCLSEVAS